MSPDDLTTDQLTELFEYKSRRSLYEAIRIGAFPVPTYKIGQIIYAERNVVREYFRKVRDGEIKKFRRRPSDCKELSPTSPAPETARVVRVRLSDGSTATLRRSS